MPHSLAHLNRLGVDPPGKPFHGISYHDGRRSVSAAFRSGVGRGVQRTALHGALLDAVAAAGVKVVQGDVGEVSQDAMSVRCGGFRARYLAAADGLHSPIRPRSGWLCQQIAGAGGVSAATSRSLPGARTSRCHWSDDQEAYVTPVSDDCVGITILTSRRGRFDRHLESFPTLVDRVEGRRTAATSPRAAAAEGAQPDCRPGVAGRDAADTSTR